MQGRKEQNQPKEAMKGSQNQNKTAYLESNQSMLEKNGQQSWDGGFWINRNEQSTQLDGELAK